MRSREAERRMGGGAMARDPGRRAATRPPGGRGSRRRRVRRARRAVVAALSLAALAWAGHGLVKGALSFAFETPPPDPTVVRCVLEPLRIAPLPCASALLVEAETGAVLYAQDPDAPRTPASLVKMMLQLLVYEEIAAGRIGPGTRVRASANAATMGGSQVFLGEGEECSVADLLDAVSIASANDASMALAEHLAGTEAAFVARMNERARELGCRGTRFANVHGLDLRKQPRNVTTARDLSIIARELVRYPRALEVSSTRRKAFRDGEFLLDNTNRLLGRFEGLDGLKTGWTPRAGGCFVATAQRDGVRLVAVVLAAVPGRSRFRVAEKLLAAGYSPEPRWLHVARAGEPLPEAGRVPAGPGSDETRPAAAGGTVRLLLERSRTDRVSLRLRLATPEGGAPPPDAPGWVDFRVDGRTVATIPARPARRG
jgi:D-alanyl-D-alanine carboxypeptidase (penicillin-binding protein 5/6)